VGMVELVHCLGEAGAPSGNLHEMNKGGSIRFEAVGVTVTMTHAFHSSGIEGMGGGETVLYGGEPAGFIVTVDGEGAFYFAGDTAAFSDMALLAELYSPKLAFLPIGDRFTMGAKEAAKAVELLASVETVVPMHFGTFPLLTGTPEAFEAAVRERGLQTAIRVLTPGETQEF
jgi:L-ascorbate metabolism protein UlaG (beta-lactamase superfamily)